MKPRKVGDGDQAHSKRDARRDDDEAADPEIQRDKILPVHQIQSIWEK